MIALIGKIAVGKSTLLDDFAKNGLKVFNCDRFIAQEYRKGGKIYHKINDELGSFLNNKDGISKQKIMDWIDQKPHNLERLENLIYPIIYDELKDGNYSIVEIPNLMPKKINFISLFSAILCLETSWKNRDKNFKKRNVDKNKIKSIDAKNDPFYIKNALFGSIPIVDIYANNFTNCKNILDFLKLLFLIS
ncbi:dephospho-CoA kinase [Mycoplasmopsis caviae]|uniref:Dephospho-CoA kinase n=1 Tax=Mycoplasmopsis caviae TaxID=55603 RepID=A0A3P8KM71_9BACT|nr:dephospho-CoA kinase [Mycoplasmopsis caviae]UUD35333.1 dephospho-CoA kinase [Mycoplasmopsis caviae]VDR41888.1 putative dephospho-CoA kinase [Mycoplasmopsis caviae]